MTKYTNLANKYEPMQLGSTGNAKRMIIRQFDFPFTYDDNEMVEGVDSDIMHRAFPDHTEECVKKHGLFMNFDWERWFSKKSDSEILNFIKEYGKADPKINWTGYRILGSVHTGNGINVWTLELFAKSPKSKTETYSKIKAPNVLN